MSHFSSGGESVWQNSFGIDRRGATIWAWKISCACHCQII